MNKYIDESIGNIVKIKNIIFDDNEKSELDHAWYNGRPCLIIGDDDEYFYFLTLTSNEKHISNFDEQYFKLNQSDLLFKYTGYKKGPNIKKKKYELKGAVNLSNVYKIPVFGLDEIGKIRFDVYKNVIEKFKVYKKNNELNEILNTAKNVKR